MPFGHSLILPLTPFPPLPVNRGQRFFLSIIRMAPPFVNERTPEYSCGPNFLSGSWTGRSFFAFSRAHRECSQFQVTRDPADGFEHPFLLVWLGNVILDDPRQCNGVDRLMVCG